MARWSRATVLQAFLFDYATIGAAKKFTMQRQMNGARGGRAVGCHSARFLLPFFGVKGSQSIMTQNRTRWRALALKPSRYIWLSQGVGARRRLFPSARISVRAVALCASCESQRAEPSQACDAQPTSKRFLPRSLGRQEASAYATRGGCGVRAKVEAAAYATLARLSARFT